MVKIIKLTETDLVNIIKKVIIEDNSFSEKFKIDPIFQIINPYLKSGCVGFKYLGDYLIIDVESPSFFSEKGFDKNDGLKIKDKLRKNGFISFGVGEYAKKVINT